MSSSSGQEKTEQATEKRREDSKKKGQIAKSREIPSVFILLTGLGVFFFAGSWMLRHMSVFMAGMLQNMGTLRLEQVSAHAFLVEVSFQIFKVLSPIMVAVVVAGLFSNVMQVGFMLSGKPLIPKLSKIDPLKGIKRLVSMRSLAELIKSLLKIGIVGGMAYLMVRNEMDQIPSLMQMAVADIFSYLGQMTFNICFYTCLVLIVPAVLDYAFQKWQHEKDLRMSKQEVKEETKQREGDPLIKARIRRTQMEMARSRMMEAVPGADVVVTNPTHLAVALKFDAGQMAAPKVVAKGAGFVAQRIKEIARENNVSVIENKPLARTLFKSVKLGGAIPVELYKAVAEVLAYVYRLKRS